jgi:predicted phage terminase large subunit-like protein
VETILKPLSDRTRRRTPLADGYAHMARLVGAALGDAPAVSHRTELFRPLPDDPMHWLLTTFPTYFQNTAGDHVPLAAHHEAFWAWLWALRPGVAARTFIAIWSRAGGKSTSLELGAACMGYFGLRRYVLYVCDTQKQANDHIGNVATLLEGLGVERAINRYGFSRGWNTLRLRTADGFTADAIGLDAALRGVRIDEARPDGIFLDELDEQLDKPDMVTKKIDILTRKILPTGASSLAVVGVQNIPNKDGIFAQLADGRAEFLLDRYVSGPHPALADLPEQDWYVQEKGPEGLPRLRILGGRPVWQGQDHATCTAVLNQVGPQAFEIEYLHRVARLQGVMFQRDKFQVVGDWPRLATCVRYWDFAATEDPAPSGGKDPDWTVGLKLAMWQGQFWVVDMQRDRRSPKRVEDLVRQTAALDGRGVDIWLEEEGGSSGKAVTAHYRQSVLPGYTVRTWHTTGSKGERAKPVSSAVEAENVFLVQGLWNTAFLEEVPRFGLPGVHDDIVDALSGAHYALTLGRTVLPHDFSLAQALDGLAQQSYEARAQVAAVLPALSYQWGVGTDEDVV